MTFYLHMLAHPKNRDVYITIHSPLSSAIKGDRIPTRYSHIREPGQIKKGSFFGYQSLFNNKTIFYGHVIFQGLPPATTPVKYFRPDRGECENY